VTPERLSNARNGVSDAMTPVGRQHRGDPLLALAAPHQRRIFFEDAIVQT